jgi:hypothetical protein
VHRDHRQARGLTLCGVERIHKTLRVTPAMAAGISDHVWSLDEIVKLTD